MAGQDAMGAEQGLEVNWEEQTRGLPWQGATDHAAFPGESGRGRADRCCRPRQHGTEQAMWRAESRSGQGGTTEVPKVSFPHADVQFC